MSTEYDAIIVGARCAGSPTAMLLARKGHRVLLLDRATFPSDTVSTHVVHPMGVAALSRWGLLDRLVATGCPPVHTYAYDFGAFVIEGSPGTPDSPVAYCPRRIVLDKLLVDAAAEAGAEVREGAIVDAVLTEEGRVVGVRGHALDGTPFEERARVVIGADGRRSSVSESVRAERYREKAPLMDSYYTYWSGLPMRGRFETYVRPGCGMAAVETHDELTMLVCGWPCAEASDTRGDIEGRYMQTIGLVPALAERMRGAKRAAPFANAAVPNYFRKPFGPGWALVGDAGYTRDPVTAQGITDAFHDAEHCSAAVDDAFRGVRTFDEAAGDWQRARDKRVLPMYEMTCELAALKPPPPQTQQLLAAIHGNDDAMEGFVKANAGTVSPADFFSAENIGPIMAAAARR